MAWEEVRSGVTTYSVDWGVVERFVRSYWSSAYQWELCETVKMSESSWYNPLSWSLPEITTLDVPWDRVRARTDNAVASTMAIYRGRAASDMRAVALDVESKMKLVPINQRTMRDELRDVQRRNLQAINAAVGKYTGMEEAATFIRDASADVVVIGSTIASGGTATALLGAGAAMKGGFKYQDTGSVGASVLYGAGSAVIGAFKVGGKSVTTAGEYALILLSGGLEGGTRLAAGDTFDKAVATGAMKVATAGVAQAVFGNPLAKKLFAKIPLPFVIFAKTKETAHDPNMMIDVANDVVGKVVKKADEKVNKAVGGRIVGGSKGAPANPPPPAGVVDEVPFESRLLLSLAIINHDKGLGNGW